MKEKQKILVSFSGGETSAYMCNYLLLNKSEAFEMEFVFANTGEENEETLIFANQCDKYFGLNLTWVEYDIKNEKSDFKIVTFETAYRSHDENEIKTKWKNHPFRKMISKYCIPNVTSPFCTRELKEYPIRRFMRSIGWKNNDYKIAIGIRADEIDRAGSLYYPLISIDITKPLINNFWDKMPFRLQLKGYEGNCKTCWKKSFRKLGTLAKESPEKFEFFKEMEKEFEMHLNEGRMHNEKIILPMRFFRTSKSVDDIFEIPKDFKFEKAIDDSINTKYQSSILHDGTELDITNGCIESCEVFGENK